MYFEDEHLESLYEDRFHNDYDDYYPEEQDTLEHLEDFEGPFIFTDCDW
jgi:hypothetical protein